MITLVTLHPVGSIVLMYRYPEFLEIDYNEPSLFITETMSYVAYIMIPLTTSICLFFNRDLWISFMIKIKKLQSRFDTKQIRVSKKFLLLFATLHCMEIINISTQLTWEHKDYRITLYFYIYEFGLLYIHLLFVLFNQFICNCYKNIDKKLKERCEFAIENKFISTSSDAKTVLKIKEYFKLYVETSSMVKDVNRLFGWIIIIIFFYTLANSVDILNWYINGETIINPDLLDLIITIIFAACTILSCNCTVNKGKHILHTAYAMEECFGMNSIIRLKLLEIAELAEHYLPRYSVLGLFDINKSTIISLISILSTYMLVVIQFNIS
ncbi:unnamed protein product [Psylliodes chrysocephalus]|uniref:Gustatory receptor n=1 Tax=Psylliodes chrysocephalus TaxID=3402493 RepID=A0A9P0CD83_9CUCU|nr:unnamed protein product [Psylliodes chrysocephala]